MIKKVKITQNRFRSKVAWITVLAQLLLIIVLLAPDVELYVRVIGGAIIEICATLGAFNDPTSQNTL